MTSENFEKSIQQITIDSAILDKRIALLNEEVIFEIKNNAGLDSTYQYSLFRPKQDLGMLLFKKARKGISGYTVNLVTLRPTANSPNKTLLSDEIIDKFVPHSTSIL